MGVVSKKEKRKKLFSLADFSAQFPHTQEFHATSSPVSASPLQSPVNLFIKRSAAGDSKLEAHFDGAAEENCLLREVH